MSRVSVDQHAYQSLLRAHSELLDERQHTRAALSRLVAALDAYEADQHPARWEEIDDATDAAKALLEGSR